MQNRDLGLSRNGLYELIHYIQLFFNIQLCNFLNFGNVKCHFLGMNSNNEKLQFDKISNKDLRGCAVNKLPIRYTHLKT